CEYPPSTSLVLGQVATMDRTCACASFAPALADGAISSPAGELTAYTPTDRPPTRGRSAPINSSPTAPPPRGSRVRRANVTSTSGQGAADAGEMRIVELSSVADVVTTAAASKRAIWRAFTS